MPTPLPGTPSWHTMATYVSMGDPLDGMYNSGKGSTFGRTLRGEVCDVTASDESPEDGSILVEVVCCDGLTMISRRFTKLEIHLMVVSVGRRMRMDEIPMPENVARHIELDIVEGQVVPVLKKRLHDDLMDLDVPISDADTEVLRRLFNRIDKDRSGSISREELLMFMRDDVDTRSLMFGHPKLAPLLRPKSWRQAFDEMDVSGDGSVTFDEFYVRMERERRGGRVCVCVCVCVCVWTKCMHTASQA